MKLIRNIYFFLSLCVSIPIWAYLWYVVLASSHVDRLVWFLFWMYLPLTILLQILSRAFENAALDERFDRWREGRSKRWPL